MILVISAFNYNYLQCINHDILLLSSLLIVADSEHDFINSSWLLQYLIDNVAYYPDHYCSENK